MEQIQQLIEILKSTPQMALWGISIYFLFILLKLASWVLALKLIFTQLIKRYFDYKELLVNIEKEKLKAELETKKTDEFHKMLEQNIYGDKTLLVLGTHTP
jgi:D-arabinose 1-dehydrogenase-like Zn-dependent alcohol dehydrogenase